MAVFVSISRLGEDVCFLYFSVVRRRRWLDNAQLDLFTLNDSVSADLCALLASNGIKHRFRFIGDVHPQV